MKRKKMGKRIQKCFESILWNSFDYAAKGCVKHKRIYLVSGKIVSEFKVTDDYYFRIETEALEII